MLSMFSCCIDREPQIGGAKLAATLLGNNTIHKPRVACSERAVVEASDAKFSALQLTLDGVLERAGSFMRDSRIAEAEQVLGAALVSLDAECPKMGALLRASLLFKEVRDRRSQLDYMARRVLGNAAEEDRGEWELVWERHGAKVWCRMVPQQNIVEVKTAMEVDASLSECMVCGQELDLIPQWNKLMPNPPIIIGERRLYNFVSRSLSLCLMFRLESVAEVFRVCDKNFGYFMESVSSDFPTANLPVPETNSWRTFRLSVDMTTLFLPRGGSKRGTLLIQVSRFTMPRAIPRWLLKKMVQVSVPGLINDAVIASTRASVPGSVWHDRLQQDSQGLYAELREAEVAAATRREVSLDTLPGLEILPVALVTAELSRNHRSSNLMERSHLARSG